MSRGVCVRVAIGVALMFGLAVAGDAAVWDRAKIRLVSRSLGASGGDRQSRACAVSSTGRFVMFWSHSWNLVRRDRNGVADTFVLDRARGRVGRVSVDSDGREGIGDSSFGGLSDDGRMAVFESNAWNLVPESAAIGNVYVRDLRRRETRLVSAAEDGTPANADS